MVAIGKSEFFNLRYDFVFTQEIRDSLRQAIPRRHLLEYAWSIELYKLAVPWEVVPPVTLDLFEL